MTLLVAVVAGVLIGLSLGALGVGSIVAVPVLVYALGQSPAQATTGSLVVGVTSLVGTRIADHADTRRLSAAFTGLVLMVAGYTTAQALPALV